MKQYIYTCVFALLCLFAGCSKDDASTELGSITKAPGTGGTEADLKKESELNNALCVSPGVWKMKYEGHDFYFRFKADRTVDSESNFPQLTGKGVYKAKSRSDKFTLSISGGGHLAYLEEGKRESMLLVSGVSATKISCVGAINGADMSLVPATEKEFTDLQLSKGVLVAIQSQGLLFGIIRDGNNKWKAHYNINSKDETVSFAYLENRVAKNKKVGYKIVGGTVKWDGVTIDGATFTGITYNADTEKISIEGSNLGSSKLTTNSDALAYFDNRGRQFQLSKTEKIGDAKDDLFAQSAWGFLKVLEINCTNAKRPLVAIINDAGKGGYIFYDACRDDNDPLIKEEKDRVYFVNTDGGRMPYGGEAARMEEANKTELNKLLAAWFHVDGLYLIPEIEEGVEYVYLVSPTTENWFKVKKTKG